MSLFGVRRKLGFYLLPIDVEGQEGMIYVGNDESDFILFIFISELILLSISISGAS